MGTALTAKNGVLTTGVIPATAPVFELVSLDSDRDGATHECDSKYHDQSKQDL